MSPGTEWIVDAYGCDSTALVSRGQLERLFEQVIADLGLQPIGEPIWHVFPDPGGITGVVLLAESHLTVHTFPESGFASLNLYSCHGSLAAWPWDRQLAEWLGARMVSVREIVRGSSLVSGVQRAVDAV
jgi:S-adenosylmethionine decarboxylase